MAADNLKQTQVKRPFAFRGPNSSADKKDSFDEIHTDTSNVIDCILDLNSRLKTHEFIFAREMAFNRNESAALRAERMLIDDLNTTDIYRLAHSFHSSDNVFYEGANEHHSLHIPSSGTVYPPRNNVLNLFYQRGLLNGEVIVTRDDITVAITDSHTGTNPTITNVSTDNMFNGNNQSYWYRKYSFAPSDDVSSVTMTLTITVPTILGVDPNFLFLHPFPASGLDIDNIWGGPGAATLVASALENSGPFTTDMPAGTDTLKLQITQRNFVEENGRKVFYLGFQEVDLQVVTWDETPTGGVPLTSSDSHIKLTIDAPNDKYITELQTIKVDGDVERIDIHGFDVGDLSTPVAETDLVTRAESNPEDEHTVSLVFDVADSISKIELTFWVNGDPAKSGDRNNTALIDHLKGVVVKTDTKDV